MTPEEHYARAEEVLKVDWSVYNTELAKINLMVAQVHATLALVPFDPPQGE